MFENMPVSPAPTPPRKAGLPRWAIAAIVVGALALLCCAGTGLFLLTGDPKPNPAPTPDPTPTAATTRVTPPPTTPQAPPTTGSVPASPGQQDHDPSPSVQARAATVSNGEWQAGPDFPPGRYETTTTSDTCVWQVTTGQGETVHYVDPGHIGPGHYTFTFKAGQTLHTTGCGTWTKTG